MAYMYARNKSHAIKRGKLLAKKITGDSVSVKVIGKPNPKYNVGKQKMYYVTIQRKRKR